MHQLYQDNVEDDSRRERQIKQRDRNQDHAGYKTEVGRSHTREIKTPGRHRLSQRRTSNKWKNETYRQNEMRQEDQRKQRRRHA